MNFKANWDGLGIFTSVACAIHCAILPILATSLPVFGTNIIHNKPFEWAMIVIALVIGIYSLLHGYKTHHRTNTPIVLFALGIFFFY